MPPVVAIIVGVGLIGAAAALPGAILASAWASFLFMAGVSTALSGVAGALAPKPRFDMRQQEAGWTQPVVAAVTPRRYLIGQRRLGGELKFWHAAGTDREFLYTAWVLCDGGPGGIEEIGEVYFGDELAISAAGVVQGRFAGHVSFAKRLGTSDQTTPALLTETGKFGASDAGKGIAYLVLKLKWNRDVFPSGIPRVSAVCKGMKLWDPRENGGAGGYVYSANPALAYHFLLSDPDAGLGIDPSRISDAKVIAAANACDEPVALKS